MPGKEVGGGESQDGNKQKEKKEIEDEGETSFGNMTGVTLDRLNLMVSSTGRVVVPQSGLILETVLTYRDSYICP